MTPAIEVSHLTKEYRLGAMISLREGLREGLRGLGARLRGRERAVNMPFKALDDVSFSVQPGEVVGVIGHNGAGKSTLLKMISGITTPTSGSVKVNGRIAPLIEVGAGFVGDFTGRENVYLNGAILGLKRKEIDRKFDEIVAFAEMEKFIDTPVKRYSSGMQVKLAFAVATSIESEILIVDEVLAVGDIAFQRKCFDRMEELIKRQHRTVLLVTHNLRQVERLCTRALLFEKGRIIATGEPKPVCDLLYRKSQDQVLGTRVDSNVDASRHIVSTALKRVRLSLVDADGRPSSVFAMGTDVVVRIEFEATRPLRRAIFAIGIHTPDLVYLAVDRSNEALVGNDFDPGKHIVECRIRNPPLLPGLFAIRASIVSGEISAEDFYGENLSTFQVTANGSFPSGEMRGEGFISMNTEWGVLRFTGSSAKVTEFS